MSLDPTTADSGGIRILVVDNHDSFVHTLVGYLRELGASVELIESDDPGAVLRIEGFDGVLLSPGPGTPEDAGASIEIVRACADRRMPLLGVCLGHQAIGVAFGATVGYAEELMHGRTSDVVHDGTGVFEGLPSPFVATRYHSLTIDADTLGTDLVVNARTQAGAVMGVRHRELPIAGVQFHPESVLTEGGYRVLGTWLESVGLTDAAARGARLSPHRTVE
ncbi:anthranilate synthase component II [Microbacterium dauci]|uniref:Gamma-glutamyl-gamma-aminobutyrate hydrolase family protein n=1 Tax=Microbacterium dauci TaxID=3048008 RepID=A0ABT6ZD35_9MICO|nr:gamma-glutamyl-gamma-aminobutyrate hydrolase family protein [Microbacterium sp. LX3-4]MDJ1114048.1 gamma-glutamyl-gamma-aminobutyrate hydrolase family protein [Microbacterium sp. LX3-4]